LLLNSVAYSLFINAEAVNVDASNFAIVDLLKGLF
jgi:hypothetical protein